MVSVPKKPSKNKQRQEARKARKAARPAAAAAAPAKGSPADARGRQAGRGKKRGQSASPDASRGQGPQGGGKRSASKQGRAAPQGPPQPPQPAAPATAARPAKRQRTAVPLAAAAVPLAVQQELGLVEGIAVPFASTQDGAEVDQLLLDGAAEDAGRTGTLADAEREALRRELELEALERERYRNAAPRDAAGFQRLLLASPNSSYLWLQFVAFWLTGNDTEKARQTAEKALQTIHYRESRELLNVWVGYLNLEHTYGTPESVREVLGRAVQSVDQPLELLLRAAELFAAAGNTFGARGVFIQACAKYPQEPRVWEANYKYCLENNDPEEAKEIGRKALQHLPAAQHKDLLLKFAGLEMRQGDVERGRSIFESLVTRMPKKTDIWSLYIDLELSVRKRRCQQPQQKQKPRAAAGAGGAGAGAGAGNKDGEKQPVVVADNTNQIRHIFERVTTLALPAKVMQRYLTRWLAFEKEYGNEASCRAVRQRAIDYVNTKAA